MTTRTLAAATLRTPVRLETPRLFVLQPAPDDFGRVLSYYEDNRAHLEPWEPRRPDGFYTERFWRDRLRRSQEDLAQDRALRLFLVLRRTDAGPAQDAGEIVGTCNLTEVVRGPFQCATLGFGLSHRHEGQGLMREALERVIPHAWDDLAVHRIQANYQPHNQRSAALLKRLGFTVEGHARDYLHIDGQWRDHILTSLTNPRW